MFYFYFEGHDGYVKADTKEDAFEKVVNHFVEKGFTSDREYYKEYLRLEEKEPLIIN